MSSLAAAHPAVHPGRMAINAARALINDERLDEAIAVLEDFLRDRDGPYVWCALAQAYRMAGKDVVSRAILRSAVLQIPDPHIVDLIAARVPYTKALVIDEHKLLYVTIPKCGSSSIKDAFILASGGELQGNKSHFNVAHLTRLVSFAELDEKYADYTTMAVIREPQDRLRSYWRKNVQTENSLRQEGHSRARYYGLSTLPSYREFLSKFHDYRRVFIDCRHHTDSLIGYLGNRPQRIKHLFGMADTARAIGMIGERAGVAMPAIHNMATEAPSQSLSAKELALESELLGTFYRAEIEAFFSRKG